MSNVKDYKIFRFPSWYYHHVFPQRNQNSHMVFICKKSVNKLHVLQETLRDERIGRRQQRA